MVPAGPRLRSGRAAAVQGRHLRGHAQEGREPLALVVLPPPQVGGLNINININIININVNININMNIIINSNIHININISKSEDLPEHLLSLQWVEEPYDGDGEVDEAPAEGPPFPAAAPAVRSKAPPSDDISRLTSVVEGLAGAVQTLADGGSYGPAPSGSRPSTAADVGPYALAATRASRPMVQVPQDVLFVVFFVFCGEILCV